MKYLVKYYSIILVLFYFIFSGKRGEDISLWIYFRRKHNVYIYPNVIKWAN